MGLLRSNEEGNMSETSMQTTTNTGLTRTQAILLARKLHSENPNPLHIARGLERAGWVSEKSGSPLTPAGARHMALYGVARKHKKKAKRRASSAPTKTTKPSPAGSDTSDLYALIVLILESKLRPEAKIKASLGLLNRKAT